MLFDKENVRVEIVDVVEVKQKNVVFLNSGRDFDALSFRFSADTVLKTEAESVYVGDHALCFVPRGVTYLREARHDDLIAVNLRISTPVPTLIEHFIPQNAALFEHLFREIYHLWQAKAEGYQYAALSILYRILSECYKERHISEKSPVLIKQSVHYMNENFRKQDLTVAEIAEKSHISEVYFRRLFKERFGISPSAYLIKKRLLYAEGLIISGYYSLKEVAALAGYTDYPYFSSEFKRLKGLSPKEYMEKMGTIQRL